MKNLLLKFLKNNYKIFIGIALCIILYLLVGSQCHRTTQVINTIRTLDTLTVEGPTVFRNKIVYRDVEPDTLYITEYSVAPAVVSMVSARITSDEYLYLEYLVNDSLHSATIRVQLPAYGDTYVTVNPDSQIVIQTQRFGLHPELTGGYGTQGPQLGFDLWYWNEPFGLPTTLHFPNIAGAYCGDNGHYPVTAMVGVSGDISRKTPVRLGVFGTWNKEWGIAASAEIPMWSF